MSFRTGLLAALNAIRGSAPRALDVRPHTVTVQIQDSDADVPGTAGDHKATTETLLTTGDGLTNPRVREVSAKDVIASGGTLTARDLKVGPFTPAFGGGGVPESLVDPGYGPAGRTLYFKVTGPGMGATGRIFERIHGEPLPNFSNFLYLRSIGRDA